MAKSFRRHLLIASATWIAISMIVSGLVLSKALRQTVTLQVEHDTLDHLQELEHIVTLAPDGTVVVPRNPSDARFDVPLSGLYWQVSTATGVVARSVSLEGRTLRLEGTETPSRFPAILDESWGKIRLFERKITPGGAATPLWIGVGVDQKTIEVELDGLRSTLDFTLLLNALGLILVAAAGIAFVMQPLNRMRRSLAAVRSGATTHMPEDLPREIAPLAREINELIGMNADMVIKARLHASNLAHSLKTPLAIMMDEGQLLLAGGNRETGQAIIDACVQMQRQIDFQLARAKAVARVQPNAATAIVPELDLITKALARLHADRGIGFEISGSPTLAAACEREDFYEIVANVLDNAGKWARNSVRIAVWKVGGFAEIIVDDDGPGVAPEQRQTVFTVGTRLDEQVPGSGLGLAIAQDLSTLYGGSIELGQSPGGGLRVTIRLPVPGHTD